MQFSVSQFAGMKQPASAAPPPPLRALLRQFRAQRPLRTGSLLVTIFGDAIAPRGGAVTLASLIELAAPFGLTERLVRTSVARLAQEGWLVARRNGRRSEYRLTPDGARRFREATRRIYGAAPAAWNGRWTLLLVAQDAGPRRQLRQRLRWLGFGALQPGLFAHPDCSAQQARRWARALRLRGTVLLQAAGEDRGADRALAAQGWDLRELARGYRRFLKRFAPFAAVLNEVTHDPRSAFLLRTLLIHEYRRIHLRDPLLPPSLLPAEWVGTTAYHLCRRLYAVLFVPAEAYLSVTACSLERALPKVHASTFQRFGGI
jgi:phenylacetic acid degradation operon negative regulatory protein